MTTFGHSLAGLALLTAAIPNGLSWQRRLIWAVLFVCLANVPDWPLPLWGHDQLAISHSLWVNMGLCAGVMLALRRRVPRQKVATALLLSAAVAWLSHFLLDSLYGNLPGVAIFWPFSDGLASLPLPWLSTLPHVPPPFDATVMRILSMEALTFGPLILLAYGWRRVWLHKQN